MSIKWSFGIESVTRQVFDEFAIGLENGSIGTGKMHTLGMISQGLMVDPARHRLIGLIGHQKTYPILLEVL
jgi:hypothetical protein